MASVLAPKHGSGGSPADEPGEFTVKDFATLYDVNPLYAKGIDGNVAAPLASSTPSLQFYDPVMRLR